MRLKKIEVIPEVMEYERISEMEQIAMKGGNYAAWASAFLELLDYLSSGSDGGSTNTGSGGNSGGTNNTGSGTQITTFILGSGSNTTTITTSNPADVSLSIYGFNGDSITIVTPNGASATLRGSVDSLFLK